MTLKKTPTKLHGARALVSQLRKEPNELKKKMLLLGYLTNRLERKSGSVYLVGGQAVETYTGGQFTTGDIDITTTDRKATADILAGIGFRHWKRVEGSNCEHCLQQCSSALHLGHVPLKSTSLGSGVEQL